MTLTVIVVKMKASDYCGRFKKNVTSKRKAVQSNILIDYIYTSGHLCNETESESKPMFVKMCQDRVGKLVGELLNFTCYLLD